MPQKKSVFLIASHVYFGEVRGQLSNPRRPPVAEVVKSLEGS